MKAIRDLNKNYTTVYLTCDFHCMEKVFPGNAFTGGNINIIFVW